MSKSKKIIIILCSILFAFLGFFGIFLANKYDSVVKADTVVVNNVFHGSGIFTPLNLFEQRNYNSLGSTDCTGYFLPESVFENSNYVTIQSYVYFSPGYNGCPSWLPSSVSLPLNCNRGSWTEVWSNSLNTLTGGTPCYISLTAFCSNDFNCNVQTVSINYSQSVGNNPNASATNINLVDDNGNNLFMQLVYSSNVSTDGNYLYRDRTYYLVTTLTDNQYYEAGVKYGKSVGSDEGYITGYNKAIEENKADWIEQGRQQGIASANDYTFLGLIGATIDAPINALFGHVDTNPESPTYNQYVGGFFNFELLGVNLRSFFFAILTFALIIVIVRFALAR